MTSHLGKSATILIVEDEEDIRDVYELIISDAGYKAQTAKNGKEALEAINSNPPDIVMLDLMMPIMDGIDALKQIRSGKHAKLPVIVMTNIGSFDLPPGLLDQNTEIIIKVELEPAELLEKIENRLNS